VTKPPRLSGRDVVSALRKFGYEQHRQRGSHILLRRVDPPTVGLLYRITRR
jgi:predicted RNA binding protein YcfA (HicA-like mRNA interferase family)